MLNAWLNCEERTPCPYKFPVIDSTELLSPSDELVDYLAERVVLAHANPEMLRREYSLLAEDAEDIELDILKQYVEEEILPSPDKVATRVGNFGEILAGQMLVEFEDYWFPIYKLRFREKKDWAMRLTDICVVKTDGRTKPLICYGEVKTRSTRSDRKLAIEGHKSLAKDDALTKPEVLRFICTWLYETDRFEEGEFFSRIRLGKSDYEKKHELFLIHSQEHWLDQIIDELDAYKLDPRLANFSLRIVLIHELGTLIDKVYQMAWIGAKRVVDG